MLETARNAMVESHYYCTSYMLESSMSSYML